MQAFWDWWLQNVGTVGNVIAGLTLIATVYFGVRAVRGSSRHTVNTATGSKRVRQSGGKGRTRNTATDSEDVEQSG